MRSNRVRGSKRTPTVSPCWAVMEAAVFSRCNPSARSPRRYSTWWRTHLADEWRRYLEQQIELGGAEVVVSQTAGQRGSGAATAYTPGGIAEGSASPSLTVKDSGRPAAPLPRWQHGAPPI